MINSYLSKLSLYYQMSLVGIAVQSKSCLLIHLELCLTGPNDFFRGTLTTGWAEKMVADWENLYGILVSWKMAKNVVFQFCNPIQKPCKHPVQETTANHGITPSIELKYVLYTSSFRERNTATISSIAFFLRLKIANDSFTGFPLGPRDTFADCWVGCLEQLMAYWMSIIVPVHFIISSFLIAFLYLSHSFLLNCLQSFSDKCCNFLCSSL